MAASEPEATLANCCRVVLVRPTIAANLGATARIMRNFGLTQLYLVAPEADHHDRQARQLSTHGESILDEARIVGDLGEAVGDCVLAVATSARTGGRFRADNVRTPRELAPVATAAMHNGPVALVFGPEPTGLSNDELTRCHYLLSIPADPGYPALNLAQAVAIVLYEVFVANAEAVAAVPARELATHQAQEHLFRVLEDALRQVGYLEGENAAALQHALRHLLGRAQLTQMEVGLLLGLARQIMRRVANPVEQT